MIEFDTIKVQLEFVIKAKLTLKEKYIVKGT